VNPSFDLLETLNLVLWLLPLPFLGLALSGRGRSWWPGWVQVGALSVLVALEFASQVGPVTGSYAWASDRERLWNFLGGVLLQIAVSEGSAWIGWRRGRTLVARLRRIIAAGFVPAGILAAFLWKGSFPLALVLPWGVLLLFETLAVATAPVHWVRGLRAASAIALAISLYSKEAWLPFALLAAFLTASQALSKIRHDNGRRVQRAREALQPKAIQELLASTTGPRLARDEDSLPVERLEALLTFAMQSTGTSGGAIFLYTEEIVPEIGTLSRKLLCPLARGTLKDILNDPAACLAAQVLLSFVAGTDQAKDIGPDGLTETYALHALHSSRLAVAPIRSRGKPMGIVVLSPSDGRDRFLPGDLHVLDFLAQQAVFSLHYDAVYHRLQEDSRMSREFEIASRIQKGLLPRSMPTVHNLSVSARVLPAREVGGDYYDLLPLPDERLVAVIGDVSGKGLPAGMIMLIVRTTLHLLIDADPDANPARLVQTLEERLVPQLDAFTFMTFLALRWSGRDRILTWSGAGHEHILWRSAQDGVIHRIRTGGLALGLQRENFTLREDRKLPLSPGDIVVLYTDGVTDCRDASGAAWGLDRLVESVERHQSLSAESMVEAILADLDRFRGQEPPTDDRTLVVFQSA
jgi:serine phosphatase RsbU (regulator of sigma subunit)